MTCVLAGMPSNWEWNMVTQSQDKSFQDNDSGFLRSCVWRVHVQLDETRGLKHSTSNSIHLFVLLVWCLARNNPCTHARLPAFRNQMKPYLQPHLCQISSHLVATTTFSVIDNPNIPIARLTDKSFPCDSRGYPFIAVAGSQIDGKETQTSLPYTHIPDSR
jgi:hypothetical protein